jgi:hypothetical protein
MPRCNKCNNLKEEKEYQNYFHSTQNITRTRKVCTDCFNNQKKLTRLKKKITIDPDKYYSTQPDFKKCTGCKDWKNKNEFYKSGKNGIASKCTICYNQEQIARRKEKTIENGGAKRVGQQPNTYFGEPQKQQVFEFLQLLGYIYTNGIWLKPDYKEVINDTIVFNYEAFNK